MVFAARTPHPGKAMDTSALGLTPVDAGLDSQTLANGAVPLYTAHLNWAPAGEAPISTAQLSTVYPAAFAPVVQRALKRKVALSVSHLVRG